LRPLIIVESPAKAKTIEKFLGRSYSVRASKGHVRDLPKSQLGVSVERDFEPRYITIRGKGDVIKELRDAAKKADRVYLATDPDREGEAISWHLAQVLGLKDREPVRIVFHEITKDAVRGALRHARAIDYRLVDAQQARRVLDRLVGYQLSPLLWRKVRPGLSAGRVQSAAVHMIVEREEEIRAFQAVHYWTLAVELASPAGLPFTARYQQEGEDGERIMHEELATAIAAQLEGQEVVVATVEKRRRRRTPPPPFTTSTLQQEASRRLGFTVRRTMAVAQALYEGLELAGEGHVGLVTYIRTDSTRIADEAREAVLGYIREGFGDAYAQPAERREKRRVGVQDAHEAIRPTSVLRHPDAIKASLSREQLQLYRLIWQRFVASAMSPAEYDQTTIRLTFGESMDLANALVFAWARKNP
jgi:DNA topoisomerase-1